LGEKIGKGSIVIAIKRLYNIHSHADQKSGIILTKIKGVIGTKNKTRGRRHFMNIPGVCGRCWNSMQ